MNFFKRAALAATIATAFMATTVAHAATSLTGLVTSDNRFTAYISTNDSVLGAEIGSANNWWVPGALNATLDAGVTYFVHIVADNYYGPSDMAGGNPAAILGELNLSGSGHKFANGGTTLLTGVANWRALVAGPAAHGPGSTNQLNNPWVAPTAAPTFVSNNAGPNIWTQNNGGNPIAGISSSADWIWQSPDTTGQVFFSTTITAVPEAGTWALMIVGFAGMGAALRARRQGLAAA
jgi:hypothetical protein